MVKMKTILLLSLISLLISSCAEGGYDYCVRESVKDGYSLEEAQESCGQTRDENGIQN